MTTLDQGFPARDPATPTGTAGFQDTGGCCSSREAKEPSEPMPAREAGRCCGPEARKASTDLTAQEYVHVLNQ